MNIVGVLALALFAGNIALSQSETGRSSLEGTVRDQNGAIVSGASVTIKSTETGATRTLITNNDGRFVSSVLPVGVYTVNAKASGFADTSVRAVLSVGNSTTVEVVLAPQGAAEIVTVTGDQEIIDREEAASGSTVSQRAISDLPIRGRNYAEFVQLSPGVVQEGDRSGLVIAGQRSINSNVAIDGADFNDSMQGNQRGGNEAVFFFPQTAIREFQVVRAGATAEVGRTNAGFVNAVTKSGTNNFAGEFFYYNRNAKLTSPDAFGNDGENNQNLVGGSIGGPIVKDKAFFFVGVEKNFLRIPYFVDYITPSGVTLPSNLAAYEGEYISSNDPISLFARTDFNLNSNNTLNFQYTFSDFTGDNFSVLDEGVTLTDRANEITRTGRSHGLKGSLITVFTPNIINEFKAQVATDNRLEEANTAGPEFRVDGIGLPGSSNARFGGNASRPRIFETLRYQFSDNVSWNVGSHRLKIGADININKFRGQRLPTGAGVWRFQSSGAASALDNFNNNIPRRLEQTVMIMPEFSAAEGYQKEYAVYLQDKWKVSDRLTVNAGLRLEMLDNPTPPNGNPLFPETMDIPDDWEQWQPRLGAAWDLTGSGKSVLRLSSGIYTARTPSSLFIRPFVENDLVSRFVRVDERSGGSCRISPTATNCVLRTNPDGSTGGNFVVAMPNLLTPAQALSLADPSRQRVFGFDPTFKNPRSFQASATFEQDLGGNYALSVGFLRNSTWNLQRRFNRNLMPPISESNPDYPVEFIGTGMPVFAEYPDGRINPAVDWISINESTAHSDYNALTVSLNRRFANRFSMSANYTYARNRDDDSNERNFNGEFTLNPYDLKAEAGYSKQDIRHNLNVSGLVDLGYGFTLSGIVITRTGFPFTAIMGDDFNGDGNSDNDRAIVNGKVVSRNSFRQPKFFNLDLRLLKTFKFGEKYGLAFSAEVFNVTKAKNRSYGADAISTFCTDVDGFGGANPNGYSITCPDGLVPSASAGVPFTAPSTARFGGPRQLQLGARFTF